MIHVDDASAVWTVTLSRPEKANSLTKDMLAVLRDTARRAAVARARGVIFTGEGRVFSAGADLEEAQAGLAKDAIWEELSSAVANLECMTVAALNGTIAGGAMGLALACDLRLCVPKSKFFYPVMKLGFLPQPSDPARMAQLIGPARTKLVLMGGQKITSEEAFGFGLVDRIVEPDSLLETAQDMIAHSAAAPFELARDIKKMCGELGDPC